MPRQKGVTSSSSCAASMPSSRINSKAAEAKERERERQLDIRRKELLGAVVADYLKEAGDTPIWRKRCSSSSAKS